MRIKFKAPDPRAGLVAQMDSSRGQQLIDAGSAVQVRDEEPEVEVEAEAEQSQVSESPEAAEAAPAAKPRAAKKK
jgi:hypothetical protein